METIMPTWSMYKESAIVVWGTGAHGEIMVCVMQRLGLNIAACCDNNSSKWGTTFHGVPVISPEELVKYQEKTDNLVVQLAFMGLYKKEVLAQLESLRISCAITFADGMLFLLEPLRDLFLAQYPAIEELIWNSYEKNKVFYVRTENIAPLAFREEILLLMLPRKTGDHTLMKSCHSHNIPFEFGRHSPAVIPQNHEKLKVISAIRDPITRDISDIFQTISSSLLSFLSYSTQEEVESFIHDKNVQPFFDRYVAKHYNLSKTNPRTYYTGFYDAFGGKITDLTQEPFDTEKGYTILNTEKANVFIYQLEKLNDIVEPLSQWLGTPFTALENGNVASNKWVASHYALAKKELVFSKEYVDAAYSDPYIKHFYSEEQIETMKSKWLGHIKPPSK